MTTKLEGGGGGRALMVGPLKKTCFAASLSHHKLQCKRGPTFSTFPFASMSFLRILLSMVLARSRRCCNWSTTANRSGPKDNSKHYVYCCHSAYYYLESVTPLNELHAHTGVHGVPKICLKNLMISKNYFW